mmetsp:Transcript_71493/g.216435  ORF Transcript_71493/g.216435 Transcript_71493/m.216435 type:complete len:335 (-) Transcript_71493:7-1011(-)
MGSQHPSGQLGPGGPSSGATTKFGAPRELPEVREALKQLVRGNLLGRDMQLLLLLQLADEVTHLGQQVLHVLRHPWRLHRRSRTCGRHLRRPPSNNGGLANARRPQGRGRQVQARRGREGVELRDEGREHPRRACGLVARGRSLGRSLVGEVKAGQAQASRVDASVGECCASALLHCVGHDVVLHVVVLFGGKLVLLIVGHAKHADLALGLRWPRGPVPRSPPATAVATAAAAPPGSGRAGGAWCLGSCGCQGRALCGVLGAQGARVGAAAAGAGAQRQAPATTSPLGWAAHPDAAEVVELPRPAHWRHGGAEPRARGVLCHTRGHNPCGGHGC